MVTLFILAVKWRCGPVERPLLPETAVILPASTNSPSFTLIFDK